jgi:hypothetical protein
MEALISPCELEGQQAYVIYESDTLDMQMFPIKRVLKQLDYILVNGILRSEALCPCEENPLV